MNRRASSWLRVAVPAWLAAGLAGCDRSQPVEPAVQAASTAKAGPTVKAPSNTNAVAVSDIQIDVSWQDNSTNETGFEVWRSLSGPDGAFAKVGGAGANITVYSDAGLNAETQYCYRVRALRNYDSKPCRRK